MDWLALVALDATNLVLVILLVAMGLVIVFGLMNVINMAHGELFLIGAYTMLVARDQGLGFWAGLAAAPLVVGLLGIVIELLVIRRIRHRFLDTILATWALSVALKQAVILAFGPGSHAVAPPVTMSVTLFGAVYPGYRLMIMGIAVAVVLVTLWLLFATSFGLKARAAMADRETTACLGIDTGRLDRWTFAYGAALAGLAGAVMAPVWNVDPQMGLSVLVPAFLAILIGGAGGIGGPILGAMVIGGTETAVASAYAPVVAQIVVLTLAILLIRAFPRGILGGRR